MHQDTVATIVGLDRKSYLRLRRAGAWPVTTEGRELLVKTADVQSYLDARATKRKPKKHGVGDDSEFADLPLPKGFRHAS